MLSQSWIANLDNSSTARNKMMSPLLRLPPETRNSIYDYVLGGHRVRLDDQIHVFSASSSEVPQPLGNLLSITKTCRQTHSESALMFFELNEFGGEDHEFCPQPQGQLARSVDAFSEPQRLAIKYWWLDTCHFECLMVIPTRLNRLPSLQQCTIVTGQLLYELPDDHCSRLKSIVENAVGREVDVLFEVSSEQGLNI